MMKQPVIADELRFYAELVAAYEEEYTYASVVYGIYFGEGDPEQDGQHWNLTRSLSDDDGICIVKEIQQVTVYGGIVSCKLTRQNFVCEFNNQTAQSTQTRRLFIEFEIDDETWANLRIQTSYVFDGESYFELVP